MPEYRSSTGQFGQDLLVVVTPLGGNEVTNTSQVTFQVYLTGGYQPNTYYHLLVKLVVEGETYTYNGSPYANSFGNKRSLLAQTITVRHADNGQKQLQFSLSGSETYGGRGSTLAGKGMTLGTTSLALPEITRQSHLKPSDGVLGSYQTWAIQSAVADFRHTVRYSSGTTTGTIGTNLTNQVGWTPPLSLANLVPDRTSLAVNLYLDTYRGSQLLGTRTYTINLSLPDSIRPNSGNLSLTDKHPLAQTELAATDFLQTISTLTASLSGASGSYGSRVTSYRFELLTGTGQVTGQATTTNGGELGTVATAGSYKVRAWVVDSRGRSSPAVERSINVLSYSPPALIIKANRTGSDDQRLSVTRTARVTAVTSGGRQINRLSLSYRYRSLPNGQWQSLTGDAVVTNSQILTLDKSTANLNGTFLGDRGYEIEAKISDRFHSFPTSDHLGTISTVYAYSKTNFGIGGLPSGEHMVDSQWPYHYKGNPLPHYNLLSGDAIKGYGKLSVDANTTYDSGFYWTSVNVPGGDWGCLEVYRFSELEVQQVFRQRNGSRVWSRYRDWQTGVWTGWVVVGLDQFFPVGAIFESTNPTSPADTMGGTWERFGNGRVLVGVSEYDSDYNAPNRYAGSKTTGVVSGSSYGHLTPYVTVYRWRRTA